MSNYTPIVDYSAKDALLTGNPSKKIRGVEQTAELNAIATAITSKEDTANKGIANGYAGLNASVLLEDALLSANIPRLASGNTFTGGTQVISNNSPVLRLDELDAGADDIRWVFAPVAGQLRFAAQNDAGNTNGIFFAVDRTDTTVDSIALTATAIALNGAVTSIDLGHASDTTITRDSNGEIAVEGQRVWQQNNVGNRINALTEDATPDREADFIVTYDASAGTQKKVLLQNVGGISGTYTPTVTNVANVDSNTPHDLMYSQVGDIVHVSGQVEVNPTASVTITTLGISLPVASDFSAVDQLAGVGSDSELFANGVGTWRLFGDVANDRATLTNAGVSSPNNRTVQIDFTYRVI